MLEELVKAARSRGHMGIVIWDQGGEHYCAGCLDRRTGCITDPRSWDSHPTVDEALADLARQMGLDPATLTAKV